MRFNSFESLVVPFLYADVEFFVNQLSYVSPVFLKKDTSFERKLSDKVGLFSAKGYGAIRVLQKLLDSPDVVALIIDCSSGLNPGLEFTRMVLQEIERETKKERQKCICLFLRSDAIIKSRSLIKILQELKSNGIHIVKGITLTALVQKMSMIFGSPDEFDTPKSQNEAIDKNISHENENDNLYINTPVEMRIVQLGKYLSEILEKSKEINRKEILFRFEMILVEQEMKQIIRKLTQFGLKLTTIDEGVQTCALHWAIKHKSLDFIKFLFDCGFDFNFQDPKLGNSVMIAILNNRIEVVEWMFESGISANAPLITVSKFVNE